MEGRRDSSDAEHLAIAMENIDDGLALFDRHGTLVMCSDAYRHLVAETPDEVVVGKSYAELLDRWIRRQVRFDTEAEAENFREERLQSWRKSATFELRTRDGRLLRVRDRPTPEGGVIKTVWDLSDDERRTDELRRAHLDAARASAAKSEFLASMSHELRTPMNAILGFTQLLLRDREAPLAGRQTERAKHVLRAGEQLLRLIDDILDLAKIETDEVALAPEPVDAEDVLREVVSALEAEAAQRGVRVAEPATTNGIVARADRSRLVQILVNLGTNAIKYNRRDGHVTFEATRLGPSVRFTVKDSGIGIPLAKQSQIFEPFNRAGRETGPIDGTGIGLVIAKQLAERMGGTLAFESEEDVGSRFWLDVPANGTADDGAISRSERAA